jgi:hypothetical protein
MDVCCVLSGRDLCDELITRPVESFRLCRVVVCDRETSWTRRPYPTLDCRARENKQINKYICNNNMLVTHSALSIGLLGILFTIVFNAHI